MLQRLSIARFKSLKDVKLEFGRVNLFIGGNGTGKSSLLEAIGLLASCLGRGLGDTDIGRKGLRITPPELMKSSFKNEDLPKTLELHGTFSDLVEYRATLQSRVGNPLLRFFAESAQFSGSRVFGRSNNGASAFGISHNAHLEQDRGMWDQIKALYQVPDPVRARLDEFSKYVIYTPQTDFLRGKQSGRLDTPPVGLHGEGLPEAVASYSDLFEKSSTSAGENRDLALMRSCLSLVLLPGWASAFGVHEGSTSLTSRDMADRTKQTVYFIDRFMHAARNRLSVYDSSEGTLFLLFATIILSHPDACKMFSIDNIDNALNPRLTKKLVAKIIEICKRQPKHKSGAEQVFLTSHNPTALDAFDLFDEDTRVFVVRRGDRGFTKVDRMIPPAGMNAEKWQLATGGRNLSQLWLDGAIPGALGADL